MSQIEAITREWLRSTNFHKQLAVIQYAFGKVPKQIEIKKKEPRTFIIEWGDDPYLEPDEDQEEERYRLGHPDPLPDPEDDEEEYQ